ncbi:S8 family serine peptidase [Algicola sagamiensis]|uniref:S8 family serine peptidase n=1 Tax=Algicola sagamiensis TaxID=163869 RepID=UPI0003699672|nr:S8 family serine peptidase [Algicola sagamiensis]
MSTVKPIAFSIATILATGTSFAQDHDKATRYIIQMKPGISAESFSLFSENKTLIHHKENTYTASLKASELKLLSSQKNIEFIEEDYKVYPQSSQEVPYGIKMVKSMEVPDTASANRTVCVIDSGLDLPHEDFVDANVTGTNDPGTGNWWQHGGPHGTHVAGTIAALNNDKGVVGVLPGGQVKLHIIKVFNAAGWGYSSTLATAIDTCVDNGSHVINMSLGSGFPSKLVAYSARRANEKGVLVVAAAGNGGNDSKLYPASYPSVVSVAAVDAEKNKADFSQYNDQVELAAPGVAIFSTYPEGTSIQASMAIDDRPLTSIPMEYSPEGEVEAEYVDCGLGLTACTDAAEKVCLIERGEATFAEKTKNCEDGGGLATVIYNKEGDDGIVNGTLGPDHGLSIPSMSITRADGIRLKEQMSGQISVTVKSGHYGYMSGTSMASPHVAGVAALVWSHYPECSNHQIREALKRTAEDLGEPGKDHQFGFGLVDTKKAYDYLAEIGCEGSPSQPAIENCPMTWNPNKLYRRGAQVSLNGVIYEALWPSLGANPERTVGNIPFWEVAGDCPQ